MKTYILVYEGFAQFEVVIACSFLKTKGDMITVGLTDTSVTSSEGFVIKPDNLLSDVRVDDVDFFLIPGGPPFELMENEAFYTLLKTLNDSHKYIGAICSATLHLAKTGLLLNRNYTTSLDRTLYKEFSDDFFVDENVVVDDHIITAKGAGYVDFAIKLGMLGDVYEDDNDLKQTIDYYRNFTE